MFDIFDTSLTSLEQRKILDLKLGKETKNFKFYSNKSDAKCLSDLSNSLDNNYQRILNDLNCNLNKKIDIMIYPDIKSFHKYGMDKEDLPDWLVGTARYNDIRIVSPLNPGPIHNYDSMIKVIVHEFTHIVVDKINKRTLRYLNEGIACYEANQFSLNSEKFIVGKVKDDKIPTFKELQENFDNVGGYQFSYTLVDYIIKRFGWETLNKLVRNPQQFENIINMTQDIAWKKWAEYLKRTYVK